MKFLVLLAILGVALAEHPVLQSFRPHSRIVGGKNAVKGQFPYQISYQYGSSSTTSHQCGGSILSPTWILTAGHCVTELPSSGTFQVVAGILNLNDKERQSIKVVQKIVHPNYKGKVNPNDIALLKLATPLKFNSLVKPIPLPKAGSQPSGEVVLSGWGSTSTTVIPKNPTDLQTINLPLVSNADCKSALDRLLNPSGSKNPFDAVSNICTGPLTSGGKGACNGDSGGPLAQNGVIVGVVSWGMVPCGHNGAPSVFTRVASFLDFIKQHVDDLPKN